MDGALICAIHLKNLKALVKPRFRDNDFLVQGLHTLQQIQLYQLDLAGSAYSRYTLQKVWATTSPSTGKGKGYGKPNNKVPRGPQTWLETPPGLSKVRPMKISKVQHEATELLAAAWTTLPEDTQSKLQAIGIGPTKPEAPALQDVLKTHVEALPQPVQELVTKLTTPEPCTEREIAAKLKGRVTELKNLSMKKTQLQGRVDQVKTQYAALLTDMQDLQVKLTEGQQALKCLSEEHMKAVNQTPAPAELPSTCGEAEQIPILCP